jgi:hypothetical protein
MVAKDELISIGSFFNFVITTDSWILKILRIKQPRMSTISSGSLNILKQPAGFLNELMV